MLLVPMSITFTKNGGGTYGYQAVATPFTIPNELGADRAADVVAGELADIVVVWAWDASACWMPL